MVPTRGFQNFPRTGENLSGDEKGYEELGHLLKVGIPIHQAIFMAAVSISRRVSVVLEYIDFAGYPFPGQALLGGKRKFLQNSFSRLIVGNQIQSTLSFRGGVFRVPARVLVQPSAVAQEHVGAPLPGRKILKQIAQGPVL